MLTGPYSVNAQQFNRSSHATMERTLEGICIPSHRVAPSSLTGLAAGVLNPGQFFDRINTNVAVEKNLV